VYQQAPALNIPLLVLLGDTDTVTAEQGQHWQQESSLPISMQFCTGGHFFIFDHCSTIASILNQALLQQPQARQPV